MLSAVVAGHALTSAANVRLAETLLPSIVAGDTVCAAALASTTGSYEPSQLSLGWSSSAGAIRLNGTSGFVPDAHIADRILVAATNETGSVVMAALERDAPGVQVHLEATHDPTRRLSTVSLSDVAVAEDSLLHAPGAGEHYEVAVAVGAIAVMCDAVGAAERMMEVTVEYAKQRQQFGRPIGSFQAVKHHCANMLVQVEGSRAAVAHACEVIDSSGDMAVAAGVAKSYAGPACEAAMALALQVHGGIGFTWEHDVHLHLKRVLLDGALFGTARWHRQRLGATLLAGGITV
jgi:alkylation response protein AidB-like acyl-CoA dehydrogenase